MDSETVDMSVPSLSASGDPLGASQDRLRADQEQQDEDQEGGGVLQVAGCTDHGRQLDDEADDQRADEGAERRAEAAEGDGGEEQQQDLETGVPLHAVL